MRHLVSTLHATPVQSWRRFGHCKYNRDSCLAIPAPIHYID